PPPPHDLQRGYRWSSSPRDEAVPPLRGVAGRLDRALRNFLETFPLFAAVVLAAHVSETHNALTEWGARLYLWGRVAYVPLYAAGVPLVRSLVWNVATVGIILFVVALLLR
ncbi:MAG: MAPEG family protein, partial [Actinomycetota bacterium]|nr:MAPEG family protein [Actinomycetota bacterium]